jgi:hypothetical protein
MSFYFHQPIRGHQSGLGTIQYFLGAATYNIDIVMQAPNPLMDWQRYAASESSFGTEAQAIDIFRHTACAVTKSKSIIEPSRHT